MEDFKNSLVDKEKAIFHFQTIYSEEIMEDYLRLNRNNMIKVIVFIFVFGVFLITFGVLEATFLAYLGGFFLFLAIVVFLLGRSGEKNIRKSFPTILGSRFDYYVFEDQLYIESVATNGSGSLTIKLNEIVDFNETDLIMTVKLMNNQIYILEKASLEAIDQYVFIKRLLLNVAKTYRGLKINRKKGCEDYEYLNKEQRKLSKKSNRTRIEMIGSILFILVFVTFIIHSLTLIDSGVHWLHFAFTMGVYLVSMVFYIRFQVKYPYLKRNILYMVLVFVCILTTVFTYAVAVYL